MRLRREGFGERATPQGFHARERARAAEALSLLLSSTLTWVVLVSFPLNEYLAKIRAAVDARQNPDLVIIARTDARAVLGFEEAVRRANAALDAGADMAFIEAPQTLEEVTAVPRLVNGPCLLNVVARGKTPEISFAEARKSRLQACDRAGTAFHGGHRRLRRDAGGA